MPARRKLTKQEKAKGYELRRVLEGYAYPRSGNCYNPTPRYRWELYLNGKCMGTYSKASSAIELIYIK